MQHLLDAPYLMGKCVNTHTCKCIHICSHAHTCTHTHTHTCTHTHVHTQHTHTQHTHTTLLTHTQHHIAYTHTHTHTHTHTQHHITLLVAFFVNSMVVLHMFIPQKLGFHQTTSPTKFHYLEAPYHQSPHDC